MRRREPRLPPAPAFRASLQGLFVTLCPFQPHLFSQLSPSRASVHTIQLLSRHAASLRNPQFISGSFHRAPAIGMLYVAPFYAYTALMNAASTATPRESLSSV